MSGKYGEPWRLVEFPSDDSILPTLRVQAADGTRLIEQQSDDSHEADCAIYRAINCVNACAALTDAQLSGGVVALADVEAALWAEVDNFIAQAKTMLAEDKVPTRKGWTPFINNVRVRLAAKPPTADD